MYSTFLLRPPVETRTRVERAPAARRSRPPHPRRSPQSEVSCRMCEPPVQTARINEGSSTSALVTCTSAAAPTSRAYPYATAISSKWNHSLPRKGCWFTFSGRLRPRPLNLRIIIIIIKISVPLRWQVGWEPPIRLRCHQARTTSRWVAWIALEQNRIEPPSPRR